MKWKWKENEKSENESENEWKWVKMSENEWKWVKMSENEYENKNENESENENENDEWPVTGSGQKFAGGIACLVHAPFRGGGGGVCKKNWDTPEKIYEN